jgi:hypothetical protein
VVPANGQWRVRDLGSVNGTVLNGRPIKSEVLRDKDEIVIGENVFVFEEKDRDAAQIAAAASHMNLVDSCSFQNRPEIQALVHGMAARVKTVEKAASKVLSGGTVFVREVLAAILAQGHLILAGMPAAAQAGVLRTIAELVGLNFAQIDGWTSFHQECRPAFSRRWTICVSNETGRRARSNRRSSSSRRSRPWNPKACIRCRIRSEITSCSAWNGARFPTARA